MPDANLLFIHALTGLHPGSGSALGVVDLPVQRERHTQWPVIPGSSLKGVMRDACRHASVNGDELLAAFGPETGADREFAGALSFTDARLLAFPVRSLRGVFAWTTCPAALSRFARDLSLLTGVGETPSTPTVGRGAVHCPAGSDLIVKDDRLLLEEFEFRRKESDDGVAAWLAKRAVDDGTAARLARNLAILSDDDFTHFARHATEVIARVGLDYETKTVKKGALFYEEFLPPETLLYAVVTATRSRSADVSRDAGGMLELLRGFAPRTLQIGADQTIGKGICAVRFVGREVES